MSPDTTVSVMTPPPNVPASGCAGRPFPALVARDHRFADQTVPLSVCGNLAAPYHSRSLLFLPQRGPDARP